MTDPTNIPNCILEQFMICAFRYALERNTGCLTDILERIEPYWDVLNPDFQRSIKFDINRKLPYINEYDMDACKRIISL